MPSHTTSDQDRSCRHNHTCISPVSVLPCKYKYPGLSRRFGGGYGKLKQPVEVYQSVYCPLVVPERNGLTSLLVTRATNGSSPSPPVEDDARGSEESVEVLDSTESVEVTRGSRESVEATRGSGVSVDMARGSGGRVESTRGSRDATRGSEGSVSAGRS